MYAVFGDESFDERRKYVFAVAGLFGSEDQWRQLGTRWQERTGGVVFHASDCDTDSGDFARFSHEQNKSLYKDLVHILVDSRILGFGSAMDLSAWNEFFPERPPGVPYLKCFREVLRRCGGFARWSIPKGPVTFTFDSRQETDYNAGVLYDYLVNLPEWKGRQEFGEVVNFASRKMVGIQAADLYAREVMKHLHNMIGPVQRPVRRSMQTLKNSQRFGSDFFMRDYFEDFSKKYDSIAASVGLNVDEYAAWLHEHRLLDSVSVRHRYLLWVEEKERREKRYPTTAEEWDTLNS